MPNLRETIHKVLTDRIAGGQTYHLEDVAKQIEIAVINMKSDGNIKYMPAGKLVGFQVTGEPVFIKSDSELQRQVDYLQRRVEEINAQNTSLTAMVGTQNKELDRRAKVIAELHEHEQHLVTCNLRYVEENKKFAQTIQVGEAQLIDMQKELDQSKAFNQNIQKQYDELVKREDMACLKLQSAEGKLSTAEHAITSQDDRIKQLKESVDAITRNRNHAYDYIGRIAKLFPWHQADNAAPDAVYRSVTQMQEVLHNCLDWFATEQFTMKPIYTEIQHFFSNVTTRDHFAPWRRLHLMKKEDGVWLHVKGGNWNAMILLPQTDGDWTVSKAVAEYLGTETLISVKTEKPGIAGTDAIFPGIAIQRAAPLDYLLHVSINGSQIKVPLSVTAMHSAVLDEWIEQNEYDRADPENVSFVTFFDLIAEAAHNNAKKKGFWETPKSLPEDIALMHEELSEMLGWHRRKLPDIIDDKVLVQHDGSGAFYRSDHIPDFSGIEEEAADVIIRLMDNAKYRGWRLPEAVLAKMLYNASRPYKHGKTL